MENTSTMIQETGNSVQDAKFDVLVHNLSENKEAFDEVHKNPEYYSGSEIAVICGLSKWKSPLKLWAEKTRKIDIENEDNDAKFIGRELEPIIGRFFERRTGLTARPFNAIIRSRKYPWAIGSPDYTVRGQGGTELAEAKSSGGYWQKEEWGIDKAPDSAQLQLQWYLMLTGLPSGYCIGFLGNSPRHFYYPHFERDDSLENQIVSMVEAFRELVKSDTPPEPRAGDKETIEDLFLPKEEAISLDTELAINLCTQWHNFKDAEKSLKGEVDKLKEQREKIENDLRLMLQGCKKGIAGPYTLRVKETHRKEYVCKATSYTTFDVKVTEN